MKVSVDAGGRTEGINRIADRSMVVANMGNAGRGSRGKHQAAFHSMRSV